MVNINGARKVNYNDFLIFIKEHNAIGPDLNYSNDEPVVENWWNCEKTKIIAYTAYSSTGNIFHYIITNNNE